MSFGFARLPLLTADRASPQWHGDAPTVLASLVSFLALSKESSTWLCQRLHHLLVTSAKRDSSELERRRADTLRLKGIREIQRIWARLVDSDK